MTRPKDRGCQWAGSKGENGVEETPHIYCTINPVHLTTLSETKTTVDLVDGGGGNVVL